MKYAWELLSLDEQWLIVDNHYNIGRMLGEGSHRRAFEILHDASYKNGVPGVTIPDENTARSVSVAKFKKKQDEAWSVQHRINLARPRAVENEIELLMLINHPNIVQILGTLRRGDLAAVLENYYNSMSLADVVGMKGPVQNHAQIISFLSQLQSSLEYLHVDKCILHRDIKPSNILIGNIDDLLKITDLQNGVMIDDLEEKPQPTRGSSGYTHPDLINSLFFGKDNGAGLRNEFFAFGATLYYALTGRAPFDYSVRFDVTGRPLVVGGEEIRVVIQNDGDIVDKITPVMHDERLKIALGFADVPCGYKEILWSLLSFGQDDYDFDDPKRAHATLRGMIGSIIRPEQPEIEDILPDDSSWDYSAPDYYTFWAKECGRYSLSVSDESHSGRRGGARRRGISRRLFELETGLYSVKLEDIFYDLVGGTIDLWWQTSFGLTLTIQDHSGNEILRKGKTIYHEEGNAIRVDVSKDNWCDDSRWLGFMHDLSFYRDE
jgi:serine/threonine protein kinase